MEPDLERNEWPVLIVGGGLVGLSTALFLAGHGVPALVVERMTGGSPLPRAAHFHLRTLELFRLAGVGDEVAAESERDFLPEGAIIAMDSLAGRKVADIIPSLNEGVEEVSPCRRLFITQPRLESILRPRAEAAGARVLEGHEVTALSQDADGVTVEVGAVGGGPAQQLRAAYVVAADGAHSQVRQQLGIGFGGRGVFSNSITIYFTADLSPWIGGQPLSVIYVNHPRFGGFFRMDRACRSGFLVVNTVHDRPDGDAAADTSPERLAELVRAGAGVPDLDVRIDGVARWRASAQVADRFAQGRVFLAGDAAHVMPPNGGFGGNTGIHDAHNLAWKLALAVRGVAGPGLLATYDAERRPVARFTVEQAYSRYVTRTAPQLGTEGTDPVAHDFDVELGYLYRSTAVAVGAGSDGVAGADAVHTDPRRSRGEPGSRAPHLWLEIGGRRESTIDLAGPGFALLTVPRSGGAHSDGPDPDGWHAAAAAAREAHPGLDLEVLSIGPGAAVPDPGGLFAERFGLGPGGASLIRPDGFVAWRWPTGVDDPGFALGVALAAILA